MKISVTSVSFSKNHLLKEELIAAFPRAKIKFNLDGKLLAGQELLDHVSDAQAVILGTEKFDLQVIKSCPQLQIVSKYGVGLDNLDMDACKQFQVAIGWTGGVNRLSVAEMTVGFMLDLARNLFYTCLPLKKGEWNKQGGCQLSGKKVGIIGVGHIGKEIIRLLKPFRCQVMVNDIIDQNEYYKQQEVEEASKENIFQQCQFITIHTPLTEKTFHLVNQSTLAMMNHDAFLINTARGPIVKLDDLKHALQKNKIAGAALDVYEKEPPGDLEFLGLPNLICTPHIGGNAKEAILAMGQSAIGHLKKFYLERK